MANKKIDLLFGTVIIVLLVAALVLMKDFNTIRANDLKQYSMTVNNIVIQKNAKIRQLYEEILVQQRMIEDLKNTLSDTRNSLESLTSKLSQPTAPVVTTAAPAAAAK